MKAPINTLFRVLAVFVLAAASASAQFKPDFKLKPDDFTVLMGVDADLSDGLNRVSHSGHGKFQVSGWTRADQSATWKVTATKAGPHEVFALVKRANNQPLAFKLDAAGAVITRQPPCQPIQLATRQTRRRAQTARRGIHHHAAHRRCRWQTGLQCRTPRYRTGSTRRPHQTHPARQGDALESNLVPKRPLRDDGPLDQTIRAAPGDAKPYEQAVADFDVEKFADDMKSTGAGFVVFTTSHAMHYFPGPLKALDEILPGRTAKRDLPADLAKALGKRGMKLFLYYHLGAHDDPEFLKASGFWETDTTKFFGNWQKMISEAGQRYGKQLAGWWFDDGSTNYYYRSAPWESLAMAAKAGFPQRFISFNAWEMNNPTQFHDYCTGEACYDPRGIDALLTPGTQGVLPIRNPRRPPRQRLPHRRQ